MDAEQNLKNKKHEEQKILAGSVVQKIREEIRNWYGNLSIRELTQNKVLIAEIEKLERLLAGKVVVG